VVAELRRRSSEAMKIGPLVVTVTLSDLALLAIAVVLILEACGIGRQL